MESGARLTPVAVKETRKSEAMQLVGKGYDQSSETVECPICHVKYLLLFDPRDNDRRNTPGITHEAAVEYFQKRVGEDHHFGHSKEVIRWA